MESGTLNFVIQGDYVTKLSRSLFWDEGEFDRARNIVGTMIGITEKQIDDVLLGNMKFTGDSNDEGVMFEEDKSDFKKTKQDMVDWSVKFNKRQAQKIIDEEQNRIASEVYDYAEDMELPMEDQADFIQAKKLMDTVGKDNIRIQKHNIGMLSKFGDMGKLFPEEEKEFKTYDITQKHLSHIVVPDAFNKKESNRSIQDIKDMTKYYNEVADAERKETKRLEDETAEVNKANDLKLEKIRKSQEELELKKEQMDMTIKTPFGNIDENTSLEELEEIQDKQSRANKFIRDFKNKVEDDKPKWSLNLGLPIDKINIGDGWLSPEGKYYPMGFQTHNDYCYDIIEYEKDVLKKTFSEEEEYKGGSDLSNIGYIRISADVLFLPNRGVDATEKQLEVCLDSEYRILPSGWDYRGKHKNKIKDKDWSNEIKEEFDLHWKYSDAMDKKLIDKPFDVEREMLNDMFTNQSEEEIIADLKHRGAKDIKIVEKKQNGRIYCKEYIVGGDSK